MKKIVKQNLFYGLAWLPDDYEVLEKYMKSNGFNLTDATFKNGLIKKNSKKK